jgi:hypothetical protein
MSDILHALPTTLPTSDQEREALDDRIRALNRHLLALSCAEVSQALESFLKQEPEVLEIQLAVSRDADGIDWSLAVKIMDQDDNGKPVVSDPIERTELDDESSLGQNLNALRDRLIRVTFESDEALNEFHERYGSYNALGEPNWLDLNEVRRQFESDRNILQALAPSPHPVPAAPVARRRPAPGR